MLYNPVVGFQELLLRLDKRVALTPSEMAEAATLRGVLMNSEAASLLRAERKNKWRNVGWVIRENKLIKEPESIGYRLETAIAYPMPIRPRIVVAVGAYRLGENGFGIYVSSNGSDVFSGNAGDERLSIDLGIALGRVTLQMARGRIF